jgi:hypothetical protein
MNECKHLRFEMEAEKFVDSLESIKVIRCFDCKQFISALPLIDFEQNHYDVMKRLNEVLVKLGA